MSGTFIFSNIEKWNESTSNARLWNVTSDGNTEQLICHICREREREREGERERDIEI